MAVARPRTRLLRLAAEVVVRFGRHRGPLFAAAVAFYMVLSLVPLLLLGLWAAGALFGDSEATRRTVFAEVRSVLPASAGRRVIEEAVVEVLTRRGAAGWWGLVGLALAASAGISTLQGAMNAVWRVPDRHPVASRLRALGVLLLTGSLFVVSIVLTGLLRLAATLPALVWLDESQVLQVLGIGLTLAVGTAMFALLYKLLPNARTRWGPCLAAGLVASAVWEAAKIGYASFSASRWGDQSAMFGALAGFMGLLVWVYLSSLVVLLGGELAEALHEPVV